jgi:hypothetical protein
MEVRKSECDVLSVRVGADVITIWILNPLILLLNHFQDINESSA